MCPEVTRPEPCRLRSDRSGGEPIFYGGYEAIVWHDTGAEYRGQGGSLTRHEEELPDAYISVTVIHIDGENYQT